MLSRNLEKSLHRALAQANERSHEYATLEHLLMALAEDQDAIAVLKACGVDIDKLTDDLKNYLDEELSNLVVEGDDDAKPTASFQRVVQRAAIHVQSSGRQEVTGANVLVAMFSERESHAAEPSVVPAVPTATLPSRSLAFTAFPRASSPSPAFAAPLP